MWEEMMEALEKKALDAAAHARALKAMKGKALAMAALKGGGQGMKDLYGSVKNSPGATAIGGLGGLGLGYELGSPSSGEEHPTPEELEAYHYATR